MDNNPPPGPHERLSLSGSQMNGAGLRRPQMLIASQVVDRKLSPSIPTPSQNLTLTIHKDSAGYGMKVCGDNPVYVESVKAGGAAQRAGLLEGDMILKVNGTSVRYSFHPNVVDLIKASATVELTVQRKFKMQQRPSSISVGPSTPLAQRGGITAPVPVDFAKRREMEFSKMTTLRLMLDQEKKNLENLLSSNNNSNANRNDITKAEGNISKLQEQLRQVGGEAFGLTRQQVNKLNNSTSTASHHQHRRAASSPDHMNIIRDQQQQSAMAMSTNDHRLLKSTSESFEQIEKCEITPPGTPPPPYKAMNSIVSSNMSKSSCMDDSFSGDSVFDTTFSTVNTAVPTSNNTTQLGLNVTASSSASSSSTAFGAAGAAAAVATANISAVQQPPNNNVQRPIISMEDDEMVDDQDSITEDHGPFRSVSQLLEHEHLAHLAVFLNFVLSNSNPAPLLFYLITGLYKEGSVKDMRKWSYEIHSTFLVPRAPLLWCGVDESLAREVDDVLQNEYDKGEILRKIFWKSRHRAKEHIVQQLNDFQIKRTAGLGTMYGPSDQQLTEAKGDKIREQRIFEETLLPKVQQLIEELDKETPNECPKKLALCSALSTVLHRIFVTRSNPGGGSGPIDRVHHFVSREKSFKRRLMGKHRKQQIRGHHLVLREYYEVTHCNHCQNIIWGVSPQGYHCTDCELNIHRACSRILEENCPGPAPSKQHQNKKSKFMDKIRPTHYFAPDKSRRQDEESGTEDMFPVDRPTSTSVVRQPSDRRPTDNSNNNNTSISSHGSTGGGGSELITSHSLDTDTNSADIEQENRESSKSKSAPVSVNRSESYKERLSAKRSRNNRRKTSDPSLSKTNDEQNVELGIGNTNFPASSSSSLSSSPSTSLEAVSGSGAPINVGPGTAQIQRPRIDSDNEVNDFETDWSSNIAPDILQRLSDSEKKRQEIINEIYLTERNHVRTLRLLERLFMIPLQESGALNTDHLNLLFPPALLTLRELHGSFEQQLKQRRIDHDSLVGDIGDLLLAMFDGRSGEELKENAAQFCARQQIALEALKEKRRKDEHLQRLLSKAESHKACRRLQLKDLLPTALQRLTKYPLLFESLVKITVRVSPDNSQEAAAIRKALQSSKCILDHVNQAVREAEDSHKLQTIQRKLDKSSYLKDSNNDFINLDLTEHKLIHDGPLIMKKNPGVQLHGLLFENMMVLLQKQDDKYILKYHSSPGVGSGESKSIEGRFNPITKITLIFVRQSAVDKSTFFLINTNVSQMLELTAPSSTECKTWFKHISDAADAYKSRTKGTNQNEVNEDPASQTITHSSAKESLESSPEKDIITPSSNASAATVIGSTALTSTSTTTTTTSTSPTSATMVSKASMNLSSSNNKKKPDDDADDDDDDDELEGARGGAGKDLINSKYNNDDEDDDEHIHSKYDGGRHKNQHNRRRHNNNKNSNNPHQRNRRRKDYGGDDDEDDDHDADDDDGDHDDYDDEDDYDGDNHANDHNNKNDNEMEANAKRKKSYDKENNEYSDNSNNTRTITQQCSLVAPSEVHVSVSPALTAEPVLTPSERLRRLDESLRETLAEKQKIVCDMFRVPNEHFSAIADIVGQPEAPKEPSDIVLAAFAQVQSLTETINEYIKVSQHQEISAVSTSLCDECHKHQKLQSQSRNVRKNLNSNNCSNSNSNNNNNNNNDSKPNSNGISKISNNSHLPPPTSPTTLRNAILERVDAITDDDGYCEIDELRLPTVLSGVSSTLLTNNPLSHPPTSIEIDNKQSITTTNNNNNINTPTSPTTATTPELKRQSTISADSIPEETEHEMNEELLATDRAIETTGGLGTIQTSSSTSSTTTLILNEDGIIMNDVVVDYDNGDIEQRMNNSIDNNNFERSISLTSVGSGCGGGVGGSSGIGTNRLIHATSIAPAVPCHLISSYVTALGVQISQLLPKLNERDIEREKLRKEIQHLREIVNSMHERERVSNERETPTSVLEVEKQQSLTTQKIPSSISHNKNNNNNNNELSSSIDTADNLMNSSTLPPLAAMPITTTTTTVNVNAEGNTFGGN